MVAIAQFAKFQRLSASPGTYKAYLLLNTLIDVRPILQRVRVPTLVFHRRTDALVPVELDRTWPMLGPKGALVVDDVDANWGFRSFSQTIPGQVSLICGAEPLRPDLRRFNSLFGIILKTPTAKV
jgi:hypothetical protein